MTEQNETPRRIRLDLNTPAELAIYNAMLEIEKLEPDIRLTEAVTLLSKAKNLVADFVDQVHPDQTWQDFKTQLGPQP